MALSRDRLCELLGIRHPIILAPMAGVAGGALAAAVTEAGGFGLIGGGYGDVVFLTNQFREAGNARVGVGFITWSLAGLPAGAQAETPAAFDIALQHAPHAVLMSFGDAAPYAPAIKAAGAKMICQIQTVDQAVAARDAGADVLVAQGQESGGHGMGGHGVMSLVPGVVDQAGDIPVLAAGGIADGRGLAAAWMLGAAGVMMGTRFYAAQEALGAEGAKLALVGSTGADTMRTSVFDMIRGPEWPEPYNGRAIKNDLTKRWHGDEAALRAGLGAAKADYNKADEALDFSRKVIWAGEGLDMIHDAPPAADIVDRIMAEATAALGAAK